VLRHAPGIDRVDRPGGRTRRITVLEAVDAETYARLVARTAPAVERSLGDAVIANRVVGPGVRLEEWKIAHRRWRAAVAPGERGLRLSLDVADCYGSITPGAVHSMLTGVAGAPDGRLIRLLCELAERGVSGLPVGPAASAVLANGVLARVDLAVSACGAPHVRWVDDLVIAVSSRRHAIRVLDDVRRELATVGLRLQDAKTRLRDARAPSAETGSRTPS
jgi:hypothetical protein